MADANTSNYRVYLAKNVLNGKQYVGLTKRDLKVRICAHKSDSKTQGRTAMAFHNALRVHGPDAFEWCLIIDGVSKQQATEIEIACIAEFQTLSPNGYNLVSGGNGVFDPSEETRQKMCDAQKKSFQNKERKEKHAAVFRTDEFRAYCSERNRKRYQNPVELKKLRDMCNSDEHKKKQSAIQKKIKNTPEQKALHSQIQKDRMANPEILKRVSETLSSRWKDPEFRAKQMASMDIEKKRAVIAKTNAKLLPGSEEYKQRRKNLLEARADVVPVLCVEENIVFENKCRAAEWVVAKGLAFGTKSQSNIGSCASGRLKSAYGYTWKNLPKPEKT